MVCASSDDIAAVGGWALVHEAAAGSGRLQGIDNLIAMVRAGKLQRRKHIVCLHHTLQCH